MRVLQVCSAEGIGGGEAHVADLARALVDRGIEVDLAVRPTSALPEFVGESTPGLVWHRVPLRNSLDLASVRALGTIITTRAIDLVHAHVARDYPVVALACRGGRAELVLTRHHYLPIKGNTLYRKLLAHATIVAVSESVRRTVIESLRFPSDRVVTISNWIDLEKFDAPRDRAAERRIRGITRRVAIGLIGQIVPLKGHEEFIRAAARVLAERTDVEFLIFGLDREHGAPFERRLVDLARQLGVSDAIRFMGFDDDLVGALAALDVVAVPSWNEAFSLVTAEAMAAGRAVVASRTGALVDLVSHEETGLLIAPHEPSALAEALVRLAADPALAERLGREARRSASQFARGPRIDDIVRLYEQSLREREV